MDTAERTTTEPPAGSASYDGFISYSHAADDLLAPRLQAGLQRFAKPWWKRRAVRIFRDESSLAANPHLWSSITDALDDSSWFVLLLSEDAASSEWVGKEIEHWIDHKPSDRILPVVTDGSFGWESGDVTGSSVPPALHGVFAEEPRWVDLRFARGEEQLDLQNPDFSAAVADIAATIRGVPKDELASEEVKQHRRTVRTAWAAGIGLAVLAVAAIVAGVFAIGQRNDARDAQDLAEQTAAAEAAARSEADANAAAEAEARAEATSNAQLAETNARLAKSRELAASAIGVVDQDPRLAVWLALLAIEETPSGSNQPVEVINALWTALAADPLLATVDHGFGGPTFVDVSPDGARFAVSSAVGATLEVRSTETHEVLWRFTEDTEDGFARPVFSPDGSLVALDVLDSTFDWSWRIGPEDDIANRVLLFDSESGDTVARLEFPDCVSVGVPAWSHDGSLLAVGNGPGGCLRDDSDSPLWVEVFDTGTWEAVAILSVPETEEAVSPFFVGEERLGVFPFHASPKIYDTDTFELVEVLEGIPDNQPAAVSLPGGTITTMSGQDLLVRVFELESGDQLDVLGELEAWPSPPFGLTYSADGTRLAAATTGRVLVWDLPSGEQTFQFQGGAAATNVAFSSDGSRLYSAHDDGLVRIWSLLPGGAAVESLGSFPPGSFVNGNTFSVGSEIGSLQRFQLGAGEVGFTAHIEFFSTSTGEIIAPPVDVHSGSVMLPGDQALIAENEVPRPFTEDAYGFRLYDPLTGESTPFGPGCPEDVGLGCWQMGSADRDEFAVGLETEPGRNEIFFFDASSLEPTGSLVLPRSSDQGRYPVEFGTEWVLVQHQGEAYVFVDRETAEELVRVEISPVGRATISPDGRYVAVRPEDRLIAIVDTETWTVQELDLGFGRMRGGAFSSDASMLAVADENEILIIDLASKEIVQEVPFGLVSDIHWIDGSTIVIGNRDGSLWARVSLDTSKLVERAREAVTSRPLSPQECTTYRIDPCPTETG